MPEKAKKRKRTRRRPSFWVFYWVALPLSLAFMIFEIVQTVG
ncbi:MAG: hypothetical protein JWN12_771 [Candidatus Saccharibacteria bacterium]|nr:hypothetical protein [Candidatus Saccharibacteria bacterium]